MFAQVFRRLSARLGAAYFAALYVVFSILAPARPAVAQESFDFATGDNAVNNTKTFTLVDTPKIEFTFSRVITANGAMRRESGSTTKTVDVNGDEDKSVTNFSVPTSLLHWTTDGNLTFFEGATTKGGNFLLQLLPGNPNQQNLPLGVPYSLPGAFSLNASTDVSVSPKFTVEHDFGTITTKAFKITLPIVGEVTVPSKSFDVGKRSIDFELDATVKVTEKVSGPMSMQFNAADDGVDFTGNFAFSTTTKLHRNVKLLKVGFAGLKVTASVKGKGDLDFGKSSYEADAHPTFDNLQGHATSNITALHVKVEGKIVADIDFTFIKEFEIAKDVDLFDLPSWEFDPASGLGSNKVLYQR